MLTAVLIDKNGNEIPVWKSDQPVLSSNVVRRIRGYFQPAALAVGILVGLVIAAIAGVFRRSPKAAAPRPTAYPDRKGL